MALTTAGKKSGAVYSHHAHRVYRYTKHPGPIVYSHRHTHVCFRSTYVLTEGETRAFLLVVNNGFKTDELRRRVRVVCE